jgi:FdhE protein
MNGGKWEARIRRAQELAAVHAFAAEGLRFYERIAGFQKTLYAGVAASLGAARQDRQARPAGAQLQEQDLELVVLLPWFASFLPFVEEVAPAPLAQSAAELAALGVTRWQEVLEELWRSGSGAAAEPSAAEGLIAWAFLQPYAEALADQLEPRGAPNPAGGETAAGIEAWPGPDLPAEPAPGDATPHVCPRCSGRPQVGVLRQQGDGGRRSLICALCATEWPYRRIVCPACGEESVDKLPIYVAEELGHVRVEACDTCRHYIKTIDLTKDGHAVPVVDELAAIPLSLWAREHGYVKLAQNLLGI